MTNDVVIPWINIVHIAVGGAIMMQWWHAGLGVIQPTRSRIHHIAAAAVLWAFGSILDAAYVFALREYGLMALRDSHLPVISQSVKAVGMTWMAVAFMTYSKQRDMTPASTKGLWFGAGILVGMVLLKAMT